MTRKEMNILETNVLYHFQMMLNSKSPELLKINRAKYRAMVILFEELTGLIWNEPNVSKFNVEELDRLFS